jgi:hypothetical protein
MPTDTRIFDSLGGTYIPNYVLWSEDFSNAWWGSRFATIIPNVITAPDGTMTGDAVYDTTDNENHNKNKIGVGNPQLHTTWLRVFVKQGNMRYCAMGTSHSWGLSTETWVFDFVTGAFTLNGHLPGCTAIDVGDGWYMLTYGGINTSNRISFGLSNGPDYADVTYSGDGNGFTYFWGAQSWEAVSDDVPAYVRTTSVIASPVRTSSPMPIGDMYNLDVNQPFVPVLKNGSVDRITYDPLKFEVYNGSLTN